MIPQLDLLLTPSNGRELVIQQQAPEFGGGFSGGRDGGDEVVVKLRAEGAVVGKSCEFGGGVEGVGGCVHGRGVGVEVGAIAKVGAA